MDIPEWSVSLVLSDFGIRDCGMISADVPIPTFHVGNTHLHAYIAGKPYTSSGNFFTYWRNISHFSLSASASRISTSCSFRVNHTFSMVYDLFHTRLPTGWKFPCYGGYESDWPASGVMRPLSFNIYPVARVFCRWDSRIPTSVYLLAAICGRAGTDVCWCLIFIKWHRAPGFIEAVPH